MEAKEFRRQASALKARERFFEAGRGLMITRIVPPEDYAIEELPFPPGLLEVTVYYRNTYVPFGEMPKDGGDDYTHDCLLAVERYNPATEAVVAIEYEPGQKLAWEIRCYQ